MKNPAFVCAGVTFYGTDVFRDNSLSFFGKCKRGVQGWGVKDEK